MKTQFEDAQRINLEALTGVVRLIEFRIETAKNGNPYGTGSVTIKGGDNLQFKIWDSTVINMIENIVTQNGKGIYIGVSAQGNVYNGNFNIVIDGVQLADQSQVNTSEYFTSNLSIQGLMQKVNGMLSERTSGKAGQLVGQVLNGSVSERFVNEFAGSRMHDATPVGLLHHTTKMMEITDLVMRQHNKFGFSDDNVDLMYVGVLLHDIGKTLELSDGVYTDNSVVSHRVFGVEMLFPYKQAITELYSEKWYYNLLSIVTQHHGPFEERPKTVFAYLVHLVDMFETQMTIAEERVNGSENGSTVRLGDFVLSVEK